MAIIGITQYRDQFHRELREYVGGEVTTQRRVVAAALIEALIVGSPVDEGEFRQGWHFSAPAPSGQNLRVADVYDDLLRATSDPNAWDETLYIQNNVPHARVLEFGLFMPTDPGPSKDPRPGRFGRVLVSGGFSTQAPRGVSGDAIEAVATRFGLQVVQE